MEFKIKSKAVMGDCIALHGLVPKNELPKKLRGKIPKDEIWVRDDVYKNKYRYPWIKHHENIEIKLMKDGMKYKKAHSWAETADGYW